jgi:ligand-binding sensor domain-containing protein
LVFEAKASVYVLKENLSKLMKSRFQLHFLTLLFILQNLITLHAQFNAPRFQRFTYAEGLPNGDVHQIGEDTEGFIWMATAQGICRFDGYKFHLLKGYNTELTKDLSNRPMYFDWDTQKRWWIGHDWAGLRLLDNTKQITQVIRSLDIYKMLEEKGEKDTLVGVNISSLVYQNNYVWVGTNKGLNVFDIKQDHLDKSGIYASPIFKDDEINKIDKDKEGNILVAASKKGLWRFDNRTKQWSILVNKQGILHFTINKEGHIWFITKYKLFQYNPLSKEKSVEIPLKGLPTEVLLTKILYDALGRIWLGSTNGLMLISRKNAPLQIFKNEPKNPYSLLSDFIVEIFEDSKNW